MTEFAIRLTSRELELLMGLAADQLFRREFIDPKMPGYRMDHTGVTQGKALVDRMRSLLDESQKCRAERVPAGRGKSKSR